LFHEDQYINLCITNVLSITTEKMILFEGIEFKRAFFIHLLGVIAQGGASE